MGQSWYGANGMKCAGLNSFTNSKVPFSRRFPIIRYQPRVPLCRNYVTHQRVSVRVVLKRFMNYVDRSACGRSLYTPVARSTGKRFWTVGRMLFTGYGFDGWIYVAPRGMTLYPLYQTDIVVMSSSFNGLSVLFTISFLYLHTSLLMETIRNHRTSWQVSSMDWIGWKSYQLQENILPWNRGSCDKNFGKYYVLKC